MRKTIRGLPATPPTNRAAFGVRRYRPAHSLLRDSSDALITPLGADAELDDSKPKTARDAFDQLEDTNASTGEAPGDPGSDKSYEGDM